MSAENRISAKRCASIVACLKLCNTELNLHEMNALITKMEETKFVPLVRLTMAFHDSFEQKMRETLLSLYDYEAMDPATLNVDQLYGVAKHSFGLDGMVDFFEWFSQTPRVMPMSKEALEEILKELPADARTKFGPRM